MPLTGSAVDENLRLLTMQTQHRRLTGSTLHFLDDRNKALFGTSTLLNFCAQAESCLQLNYMDSIGNNQYIPKRHNEK